MITVGMNYHVLPGKQQDFEEKFVAVLGALRSAAVWGPWISIGAGILAAVFAVLMLWSSRRLGRGLTALGLSGLLVGGAGWAALEIGRGKVENALNQSAPDVRQAADAVVATVTASTG